jgi:hypothetical protein
MLGQLICFDVKEREVARFPDTTVFGRTQTLKRIQPYLVASGAQNVEAAS